MKTKETKTKWLYYLLLFGLDRNYLEKSKWFVQDYTYCICFTWNAENISSESQIHSFLLIQAYHLHIFILLSWLVVYLVVLFVYFLFGIYFYHFKYYCTKYTPCYVFYSYYQMPSEHCHLDISIIFQMSV